MLKEMEMLFIPIRTIREMSSLDYMTARPDKMSISIHLKKTCTLSAVLSIVIELCSLV
uniref:Gamma-secretase activating protein n=1 Tax=Lynx canadensis TaxID=61383 RepID=A0A667GPY6_LYNCA